MTALYGIFGITLAAVSVIVLLRQIRPEYELLLSVATVILLIIFTFTGLGDVISMVSDLCSGANIDGETLKIVLKAVGVCFLCRGVRDICADCGQSALAEKVETAGRITITVLSLPLLWQVVGLITQLTNG